MAVSKEKNVLECPECDGEMKLERAWTETKGLLGMNKSEKGTFKCRDCGYEATYTNEGREKGWV